MASAKSSILLCSFTLLSIFLWHISSIYVFCQGFLLSRSEIAVRSSPETAVPSLKRYGRAIILVVDALRSDFLISQDSNNNQTNGFDPNIHNRLTVPLELIDKYPEQASMFHFVADPPTTTLQRLKGLTTGSLPTFFDAASNFSPNKLGEDSWLEQAVQSGLKIAFAGDDTWTSLYPIKEQGNLNGQGIFDPTLTFPQDSFDVHDLDTVDTQVKKHVLNFLNDKPSSSTFDILIAHNLGLDHSGHRWGPSHHETARKLDETNSLIEQIIPLLRQDDLFLVFGDHGMDSKGDHGGDSPLELDAALWAYSKSGISPRPPQEQDLHSILSSSSVITSGSLPVEAGYDQVELSNSSPRPIPQVSLVPTLSLLLGIPIPFSNLGPIIPEFFVKSPKKNKMDFDMLTSATKANADQVQTYLEYMVNNKQDSSGSDFGPHVADLISLRSNSDRSQIENDLIFIHTTLAKARQLWTTFDLISIILGLVPLLLSTVSIAIFMRLSDHPGALDSNGSLLTLLKSCWVTGLLWTSLLSTAYGALHTIIGIDSSSLSVTTLAAFLFATLPQISLIYQYKQLGTHHHHHNRSSVSSSSSSSSSWWSLNNIMASLVLVLHVISQASNSFIVQEATIVHNLCAACVLVNFISSFGFPRSDLRKHGLWSFGLALIGLRILRNISLCREEQRGTFCQTTFYHVDGDDSWLSGSSSSSAPMWATILAIPLCFILPEILGRVLDLSGSRQSVVDVWMFGCRTWLLCGSVYWLSLNINYSEPALDSFLNTMTKIINSWSGMIAVTGPPLFGLIVYPFWPLPISIERSTRDEDGKPVAMIKGFANCMGTLYILFWITVISLAWGTTQLAGQVALAIATVIVLLIAEGMDSEMDAHQVEIDLFAAYSRTLEQQQQQQKFQAPVSTPRKSKSAKANKKNSMPIIPQEEDQPKEVEENSKEPGGRRPTLKFIFMIALLGYQIFFSTGHQVTISSLQWKSAFVGGSTGDVVNIWSALLVTINTLGPTLFISALFVPALAMWKISPRMSKQGQGQGQGQEQEQESINDSGSLGTIRHVLWSCLGYIFYQTVIGAASCIFSTHLRRHLMFWKIFAPRTMFSLLLIVSVDFILLFFGVGFGSYFVLTKTQKLFGTGWR